MKENKIKLIIYFKIFFLEIINHHRFSVYQIFHFVAVEHFNCLIGTPHSSESSIYDFVCTMK